jgi:hypothetical protein
LAVSGRIDAPDAIGAEIGFACDCVCFAGVSQPIRFAAAQADFLGAEPDDADRAARTPGVHDALGRGGRDRHAGAVVDRAGALVPAVEVTADQHDAGP